MRPLADDLQKFLDSRELFGWQLGLSRVEQLSRRFGNPHRRYPIIHIAGTNGKGSTAAMLEAVLRSAGYRTGLYTSPHLLHVSERIRLNGLPISLSAFEKILRQQKKILEAYQATYFESLTMTAFAAFANAKIDVAVVEVGLGGRLDATNIVRPVLCIIPSIGFDHQKFLGRTLSAIAGEKAGIVKRRVPCVIGKMSPRAAHAIVRRARQVGAQIYDAWQLCKVHNVSVSDSDNLLSLSVDSTTYENLRCNLIGRHQINNTLCAVSAVHVLNNRGFEISEAALRRGLQSIDWPGRFQILQQQPAIIIDVAHNPAGMRALVRNVQDIYPSLHPVVVLGVLADKDFQKMLRAWKGVAAHVVCCQVESTRALPAEKLHRAAGKLGLPSSICPDPRAALAAAQQRAGKDGVVCVTGSHYGVGQIIESLRGRENSGKIS